MQACVCGVVIIIISLIYTHLLQRYNVKTSSYDLILCYQPIGCDALHTGLLPRQAPGGCTLPSGATAHHLQTHPRGLWYVRALACGCNDATVA